MAILGTAGPDLFTGTDGPDDSAGLAGADTADGRGGDDLLDLGPGPDFGNGGGGADVVLGQEGEDSIVGGEGNDSLTGGTGQDTLNGGVGNDQLTGGPGPDRFVFEGDIDVDTITDFDLAEDVIDLLPFINGTPIDTPEEMLALLSAGPPVSTDIGLGSGNGIRILGVSRFDLTAAHFAFHELGAF